MPCAPTFIVFLGGAGLSTPERLVDITRTVATIDTIHAWFEACPGSRMILVTDDAKMRAEITGVDVDIDTGDFHFGRRLASVIRAHNIESAVYTGGGSVPLFAAKDFVDVVARLVTGATVTNNLYSSDLVGFPVNNRVLETIANVDRDNSLARALKDKAGLEVQALTRNVTTQFDIDTPTDVAVLAVTHEGGPQLRAHLASLDPELEDYELAVLPRGLVDRYRAVLPLFLDVKKQIVVAGRVGTQAWSYLERETACRVRLFAEERGMEADGRAASGTARSLLGYYLDAVGLERFFQTLGELGDAAFIDTRVLLAHKQIDASREDRFLSDLGRWESITDPFLRDFTRAAVGAHMPVLLGGHSLMAGGLMALNEYAWQTLGDD